MEDGQLDRIAAAATTGTAARAAATAAAEAPAATKTATTGTAGYLDTDTGLGRNLLRFALGGAFLFFGAKLLVTHAPVVGLAWGFTPLITGLIVVAIATAVPEAAAAVAAARRGLGDIVVGHVIGSSLFNLLIVVGGMAAIRDLPVPDSFVRFELPAALASALLLYPMLRRDLQISRPEGWVLLLAFVAWVVAELLLVR